MVLKSAEISGLAFPTSALRRRARLVDEATERTATAASATRHGGTGKVFVPGKNEQFDHHESMTAIGVMSPHLHRQEQARPAPDAGCDLLVRDLPEWKPQQDRLLLLVLREPGALPVRRPRRARCGRKWNEPMKNALVPNQKTGADGCENGSWDAESTAGACEGGRVYADGDQRPDARGLLPLRQRVRRADEEVRAETTRGGARRGHARRAPPFHSHPSVNASPRRRK